jgi:hypothetical protein
VVVDVVVVVDEVVVVEVVVEVVVDIVVGGVVVIGVPVRLNAEAGTISHWLSCIHQN